MDVDAEVARWQATMPIEITADPIWKNTVYRLATFLSDYAWEDITHLAADPRTVSMADQLQRSIGGIGANFADAYSRGTDRDRCRVVEYALSEAREARDWVYKARHVVGPERTATLLTVLSRIVGLLVRMIVNERSRDGRLMGRQTRRDRP